MLILDALVLFCFIFCQSSFILYVVDRSIKIRFCVHQIEDLESTPPLEKLFFKF